MTKMMTKMITALMFAGAAISATAQAETAPHMTGETADLNSHITTMNNATGAILDMTVMTAADAIVLAETAQMTERAQTPLEQFAANDTPAPTIQVAYGYAPAFFLVPIAD